MRKGGWTRLGKEKLESSGLTTALGEQLGMYEVPSAATLLPQFDARAALIIPYHDINRKPAKPHRSDVPFYRVRYLERDPTFSSTTKKPPNYVQPAKTPPMAYLPTIGQYDWKAIAADPEVEIIITEGELKAAAACMQGYPTLGMGGVYAFKDVKNGRFFLKELEEFAWVQRTVYICYDSDFVENTMVTSAINSLCDELQERGAFVKVVMLPNVGSGKKTGLDDYFLVHGNEDFDLLLQQADELGMTRVLWDMNKELIYVNNPGMVVVMDDGQKMAPGLFKEHSTWSTLSAPMRRIVKDHVLTEKTSGAAVWLRWPLRRAAKRMTYAPGQERITENNEYNLWPGWGCAPAKGDVKLFIELIDFLFADMEPKSKEWFLNWLAYPIQHPGYKMFSAVIVHGLQQGTGKSLVGYTMRRIYGDNWKEITDKDLESDYTQWAENRQFIMGDEITGRDNRAFASTLKRIITQQTMTINIKHLPQYEVPDVMNYYYTAQHVDSFFLEDTDRRFFVAEQIGPPMAEVFYTRYWEWLQKGGGSAVFQWLLDRKIPATFNPAGPAMRTAAKERMIVAGKGELSAWVHALKQNPDEYLMFGNMRHTKDLYTAADIMQIYETAFPNSKVTTVGMGRALAGAGFVLMDGGQPMRAPGGKSGRYYAIRNPAKWTKCADRKLMEKNIAMQPIRTSK